MNFVYKTIVVSCWNKIIGSSSTVMNKFFLFLWNSEGSFWTSKFDEIMRLERKFESIIVTLNNAYDSNVVDLFTKISAQHGKEIKQMEIHNARLRSSREIESVLNNMPKLKELEICDVTFVENAKEFAHIKQMKELKILKMENSSWKILEFFKDQEITKLRLDGVVDELQETEHALNFFNSSHKLEVLEITREAFDKVFASHLSRNFPFKLGKLKFSTNFIDNESGCDENFNAFLRTQMQSLESLDMEMASQKVLETIFMTVNCLKYLKLGFHALPIDENFYESLCVLEQIKELEFHTGFKFETAAKAFFKKCPNLEILQAEMARQYISEIVPCISIHNPKITALKIITISIESDVKFNFLKYLCPEH